MLPTQLRPTANLLVTDLDNTLWDWFSAWHSQFDAFISEVVKISGITRPELESEIRTIHQRHKTAEYSWLVDEIPALIKFTYPKKPREVFDSALHAQNAARKRATSLYPGVQSTLQALKNLNIEVVAYTESQLFWTEWRLKGLGLDGLIECLYSSPDHDLPDGMDLQGVRKLPDEEYGLRFTKHESVSRGITKPDPQILQEIIARYDVDPKRVVYVGDSKMKDIAMAQQIGVLDVWAAYGEAHQRDGYDSLRRVSHWPDSDIEKEREPSAAMPTPTYTLHNEFSELLEMFHFEGK